LKMAKIVEGLEKKSRPNVSSTEHP